MTVTKEQKLEVLLKAKELITTGWTQEVYARDIDGEMIGHQ